MKRIQVLEAYIANQIAAGEVVERPASIAKELVENSIDAGATAISVDIKNGGIDFIRVTDNGEGISSEDVLTAFERHATSKIKQAEQLAHIETLGFRGEALCSIAAVAQVSLITLSRGEQIGTKVRIEGGECKLHQPASATEGTSISVENLFYNVPARRKFLRSARTESGAIGEHMARLILARSDIAFRYSNNDKLVYQSPGKNSLRDAIYCVYGAEVLPHLREVELDNGYIRVSGFIGLPEIARPNRRDQIFILNGRGIRAYQLGNAVQRAFDTRIMGGRFAFAVLQLRISSREVDVNVHPTKMEVRFAEEGRVYTAVLDACKQALGNAAVPELALHHLHDARNSQTDRFIKNNLAQEPPSASFGQMAETAYTDTVTPNPSVILPAAFTLLEKQQLPGSIKVNESSHAIQHYRVQHIDTPTQPEGQAEIPSPAIPLDLLKQEQQQFGETPATIIGQAFNTYWILQQGEALYFIDQHAAHERKLYERLMATKEQEGSQQLLAPEILQLSQREYMELLEHGAALHSLGFGVEPFGPSTIRILEIPMALSGAPVGKIIREALELLRKGSSSISQEMRRDAIIQAACKHAVKAGDPLTKQEILALLEAFMQGNIPMTCPHGRPVMFLLTRKELEKMFKRIV